MKKLLLTLLCVLAFAYSDAQNVETSWHPPMTYPAETPQPFKSRIFLYFKKYDMSNNLITERYQFADLKLNSEGQYVFTEGELTLTLSVLETEDLTTVDGLKTKFIKIENAETKAIFWLQIFEEEEYGVRFIVIGKGSYRYFPNKP